MLHYRPFYRRRLPHFQPPGATLFITFRLAGSLPQSIIHELAAERERRDRMLGQIRDPAQRNQQAYLDERFLFGRWDTALHAAQAGSQWLSDMRIAQLVADSLHFRHDRIFTLHVFCIMPNHVHLVCTPLKKPDGTYHAISAILHSLKRYTARQANSILQRQGSFWQPESYDHVVRDDEEFLRITEYVLNNPVKAGLASTWEEWAWSYVKET
jgi:putative transposase